MKRVSQLAAFALLLGLASSTPASAQTLSGLTVEQLHTQRGVAIDTRQSAFYNGWPQRPGGAQGHEAGALNLSASWLSRMDDNALRTWAQRHAITRSTPLALYGDKADTSAIAGRLDAAGFSSLHLLSDALTQPQRLQKLAHVEQMVYPAWISALQKGEPVAGKPAGNWKIAEVGWGKPKLYLLGHIPGADYIDTNEVEQEPLWNTVTPEQLRAMLAKHGIRHDTTVILYGRHVYAAARVAQILLYAGVRDVRLLDGGWQSWADANLPVARGFPPEITPAADFGAPIPAQPQFMVDTAQARQLLRRSDASLVSIRSWPEFIGTTSGYSYIKPKGDIAGARWGHGGSDSTHMEDFHNPDGTMVAADDIAAMWKQWNIEPHQRVAFYCGTGWRAAETFMYARAMGWQHIALYDGGWYEWSSDPKNPIATGERSPE